MAFEYFYGKEADAFSFYRIPKVLFTDEKFKELSVEAKVLYGLLLDRMSLSAKNQWLDTEGKVYVYYSVENIMESIGCSKNKAVAILKELDNEVGIGLVEKRRMGQGKPSVIYVKNFMEKENALNTKNQTSTEKEHISESLRINSKTLGFDTSRGFLNAILESQNLGTNKNNINNNNLNNTDSNQIISSGDQMRSERYTQTVNRVSEKIELDILAERYPYDTEMIYGLRDLIVEMLICEKESVIIAGSEYPAVLIKDKFEKLDSSHIEYVLDCLKSNTTKIQNIKKYMLAVLFNAPTTIKGFYQAEVNNAMPQYAQKR